MAKNRLYLVCILSLMSIANTSAGPFGWSDDTRLTFDNSASSENVLSIDLNGNVHVIWRDSINGGELYYKKLNNLGMNLTDNIRITFHPTCQPCPGGYSMGPPSMSVSG